MVPLPVMPVVAIMQLESYFKLASCQKKKILLLLSLFGDFLAPYQHNCEEVGGVPQLRFALGASGGAVHSFGNSFLHILPGRRSIAAVFVALVD